LLLQNLWYERNYLKKEIQACQEFRCVIDTTVCSTSDNNSLTDRTVNRSNQDHLFSILSDSNSNNKTATGAASKRVPEEQEEEIHRINLQRLKSELEARQRLVDLVNDLGQRKKDLQETSVAQKKKFLDGLHTRLKNFSKASVPIQQYMTVHATTSTTDILKQQQHNHSIHYLPPPLYILFFQFHMHSSIGRSHAPNTVNANDLTVYDNFRRGRSNHICGRQFGGGYFFHEQ
jgi:hypothetical protein